MEWELKCTDLKFKVERYTLDVPEGKFARYTLDAQLISPNSHHTPSVPNSKNDPLEWYTFEEAIQGKTWYYPKFTETRQPEFSIK